MCFDTALVRDILRVCGGNVDEATEMVISRMNSSNAEAWTNKTNLAGAIDATSLRGTTTCRQSQKNPASERLDVKVLVHLKLRKSKVYLQLDYEEKVSSEHLLHAESSIPVRRKVADDRKPANNKPCPCGSGRRYKHCCKAKERLSQRIDHASSGVFDVVRQQLDSLDI